MTVCINWMWSNLINGCKPTGSKHNCSHWKYDQLLFGKWEVSLVKWAFDKIFIVHPLLTSWGATCWLIKRASVKVKSATRNPADVINTTQLWFTSQVLHGFQSSLSINFRWFVNTVVKTVHVKEVTWNAMTYYHTICLVGTMRLGKPVVLLFTLCMWRCRGFVSFEKAYSPYIQCCQKAVFWILINTTQKQTEGKAMALSSTGSTESLGKTYSVVILLSLHAL